MDGASDLTSGLGPDQGLGVLVPVFHEVGNGSLQLGHTVEAGASDRLLANHAEPALHQIEPRSAGGSEVEMKARMPHQPLAPGRMVMGSIVVADQMQLPARIATGQGIEEFDELLVAM